MQPVGTVAKKLTIQFDIEIYFGMRTTVLEKVSVDLLDLEEAWQAWLTYS